VNVAVAEKVGGSLYPEAHTGEIDQYFAMAGRIDTLAASWLPTAGPTCTEKDREGVKDGLLEELKKLNELLNGSTFLVRSVSSATFYHFLPVMCSKCCIMILIYCIVCFCVWCRLLITSHSRMLPYCLML
jgi:hypothetical protein